MLKVANSCKILLNDAVRHGLIEFAPSQVLRCSLTHLNNTKGFASRSIRQDDLPSTMSAWRIHEYGGTEKLRLSDKVEIPTIQSPHDVLVEVHAASVNPIDVAMLDSYGHKALNALRMVNFTLNQGSEFPLTLGRDFSGKVVGLGEKVDRRLFPVGSEVWGAGNVAYQGTFAQYITVSSKEIWLKPKKLSHVEAGSIPYVAGTTWTAINSVGRYNERNLRGKRVLVIGASGGIGTFAVQLLKAWGADVTAICSTDATEKVLQLGANAVLDYKQNDVWQELQAIGHKFDLVFDAVGGDNITRSLDVLTFGGTGVSIITPFLRNTDSLGVLAGTAKTGCQAASMTCKGAAKGCRLHWVLFAPSGAAMKSVSQLVDGGKIVPVVEKVFPFTELPAAFEKVKGKHNRGKIVIDVKSEAGDKSKQ